MIPRISIAMATYNGAKFLRDQLDSFICQTRQPDEVVICDDGSTDTTLEILREFSERAPFAVHVHQNRVNLGYTKNFERAMSLCIGDLIFLSDQDDVWFREKIEIMTQVLADKPEIYVLQTDMVLVDEALNATPYTQLGNIRALGHHSSSFVTGCGSLIRKAWLDLALPIPADVVAHDNWLHRLALALGARELYDKPLQYYRRHGNNESNWIASKPVRMSGLTALRAHGLGDAVVGWRKELERVKATLERLEDRVEILNSLGMAECQAVAVGELKSHIESLDLRIQSVGLPRLKRWQPVLALWLKGGYRHFFGWKSAVKDLVRP